MPKVAINEEHMCLYYGEKNTWLFTNTATKITRCGHTDTKKQNLCFKLDCRNTLYIIISGQFNICTNLPFIVNLKTKIPKFDTLAIEDMFF